MIDMDRETLMPLAAAARRLPGRPHVSTMHRWRQRGIRGVQLEAVLVGGVWHTSREALRRFIAATTAAATGRHGPSDPRPTPSTPRHVTDELDRAGIR